MYHSITDKTAFLRGERTVVAAARDSAAATAALLRSGWRRAEADAGRIALSECPVAHARIRARRERYRVAHREAMALADEVAELDHELGEDGDLDEYGYVA